MSQTRDQKRFTISELAADWYELMIPQRSMSLVVTVAAVDKGNVLTVVVMEMITSLRSDVT